MSRPTYPLKLSESIKKEAQRLAKEDGVSLNHWISAAVARRAGVEETAALLLARRSAGGSRGEFIKLLKQSPNRAPDAGDEID